MTLIGQSTCPRCGCDTPHQPDSTHPLDWCPNCGAACWHDRQPIVIHIPGPLEPFGRAVTTALNYLNSWLGAAIRL